MSNVILATAGYDHTIKFWEAPTGVCYRTLQFPDSQVNKLEITPDGQHIAAAGNPHVKLFDVTTTNPNALSTFEGHTNNVTAVGFQQDGRWMFTGSEDGTVKIWDLRAPGRAKREYKCGSTLVNSATLHPNGAEIVVGLQNGTVGVCDLSMAKFKVQPHFETGEVGMRSVTFSGEGKTMVTANNEGKCFVFDLPGKDVQKMKLTQELRAHKTYILTAMLSPDGKTLATTSADKTVGLWNMDVDPASKAPFIRDSRTVLKGHERWVWDCCFSADSAYIITASSDQVAKLWEISNGDVLRHYTGHHKAIVVNNNYFSIFICTKISK